MTVIHKEPYKIPKVIEVENTLPEMRKLVGNGHLEFVPIRELQVYDIDLFCNEEWRELKMEPNLYHKSLAWDGLIGGPVYFSNHDHQGESVSLTKYQISIALKWINRHLF